MPARDELSNLSHDADAPALGGIGFERLGERWHDCLCRVAFGLRGDGRGDELRREPVRELTLQLWVLVEGEAASGVSAEVARRQFLRLKQRREHGEALASATAHGQIGFFPERIGLRRQDAGRGVRQTDLLTEHSHHQRFVER